MAGLNAPPARASLRRIILDTWPWLARVGVVASGALGIRSAAGRTELEGGGAAVLRVGDGGRLAFDPTVPTLYYSSSPTALYVAVAVTTGPPAPTFPGTPVAPTGSSRVTCG